MYAAENIYGLSADAIQATFLSSRHNRSIPAEAILCREAQRLGQIKVNHGDLYAVAGWKLFFHLSGLAWPIRTPEALGSFGYSDQTGKHLTWRTVKHSLY